LSSCLRRQSSLNHASSKEHIAIEAHSPGAPKVFQQTKNRLLQHTAVTPVAEKLHSSLTTKFCKPRTEEEIEELEHRYPFASKARADPTSANKKQVFVNMRRASEFDGCDVRLAFD